MPHSVWTLKAQQDFEQIIYYIRVSAERPLTAQQIAEEIVTAVDRQTTFADSGPRHPAAPACWRYVRHKRWLIFYEPRPDGLEVMRVIDGARDLSKALADLPEQG